MMLAVKSFLAIETDHSRMAQEILAPNGVG
jgi:hypothetical protein